MQTIKRHIPPPLVTILYAAAMFLIAYLVPDLSVLPSWSEAARPVVLCLLLGSGLLLALLAVLSFRRVNTTVNPNQLQASTVLVTQGVFAVTRNPMYLGLLCLLIAWAVWLTNIFVWPLLVLFHWQMTHFQIKREERALLALFGEKYRVYQQQVRRWL